MKLKRSFSRPVSKALLFLSFLFLLLGRVTLFPSSILASDEVSASVLEVDGTVESKMADGSTRALVPGDFIQAGEELNLKGGSKLVLSMADNTVRKFEGPATITLKALQEETEGSVVARLGSALVELLFTREKETSEGVMATRAFEGAEGKKSQLPLLLNPAPGSHVPQAPTKFSWRKIDGVPFYRVSVYGWDRLMWQGTTSESYVECPAEHCSFEPGEPYYWVVEALIGNSSLRSEAAQFKILTHDARSELQRMLDDRALSILSKVRLCLALGVYGKALELIDSHWKDKSLDRVAYLLRAEIKERMGLLEDAYFDYKKAASLPPIR